MKNKFPFKRVLVTGGAGFIGSHVIDNLVNQGARVYAVDDLSGGYRRNVNKKAVFVKLDLRDRQKTRRFIEKTKPDLIYHLAADATEGRSQFTPIECTDRNFVSYLNLLIPAIRNGLKRIVVTSSIAVYGNQQPPFTEDVRPHPEDMYGISKFAMEQATEVLASVHGFEYVIVRPHNVFGPRQNMADPYRNVVAIFINRLLAGKPFYLYGDGSQKRAFTYIDDVAPAIVTCGMKRGLNGHRINIGSEIPVTVKKLSEHIIHGVFGGKDIPEKLKPIILPSRPREVKFAYSSTDKAKRLLNYKPSTPLLAGLQSTIAWAKQMGYQKPKYLDSIELMSKDLPRTWKAKLI